MLKQAIFRKVNMTARMICVPTISLSFRIAVVFRSQRLREKMPLLAHGSTSACKSQVMCSGPTWLFPPSKTVLHENTADCWKMCFWGISFFVCVFSSFVFALTSLTMSVPTMTFICGTQNEMFSRMPAISSFTCCKKFSVGLRSEVQNEISTG